MRAIFRRAEDEMLSISEIETVYYQGGEMVIRAYCGKERCCPMPRKVYNSIIESSFESGLLLLRRFYFRVDYKHIHILNIRR